MMEQMELMVKMEQMDKMAYKVPREQLAHRVWQEMMVLTEHKVHKGRKAYLEHKELLVLKV